MSGIFTLAGHSPLTAALAEAQQPAKVSRIGYLTANSSSAEMPRLDAFRQGLRALGHVEGKNIVIEYRFTDGKFERLPDLAAELVRLKVEFCRKHDECCFSCQERYQNDLYLFHWLYTDPVAAGLVDSFARPGGNITGLTNIAPVLSGKRLELLKETVPKLTRVAVLWDPQNPGSTTMEESQLAARELGLQLHSMEVSRSTNIESAFKEATKSGLAQLWL